MGILSSLKATIGKTDETYKKETDEIMKDARKQYGFAITTVGENRTRRSTNFDLYPLMLAPAEDLDSLTTKVVATVDYLENNLDFMEPQEREHVANAVSIANDMAEHWLLRLAAIKRAKNAMDKEGLTGNLQAETLYETKLAFAEMGITDWMRRVKKIVDAAAHSKSDHMREAIVIGQIPINPMMGGVGSKGDIFRGEDQ